MENQRTAILIGTIDRELRNLSKKEGVTFVSFSLNCTMPHDKFKVFVKVKAGGEIAKQLIAEAQKNTVMKIQGLVDSTEIWRREPCDKCKKEYEGIVTLFHDEAKIKFISGHKSQIGEVEDLSDGALRKSLERQLI